MPRTFSNNAESTLASGIAAGATSLTVQAGHGARFPTTGDFTVRIQSAGDATIFELVTCTARTTDTLTVTATAGAWNAGSKVFHVVAKADLDAMLQTGTQASQIVVNPLVNGADDVQEALTVQASSRGARAYATALQTLVTATLTPIILDAESFDSSAFHDNVTNNTRFTVPAGMGGKYLLTGAVTFASNSTGGRDLFWRRNGTEYISKASLAPSASGATAVTIADVFALVAGDYVELVARQYSGANLNTAAGEGQTYGSVAFMGK